jgi:hypothetical protein
VVGRSCLGRRPLWSARLGHDLTTAAEGEASACPAARSDPAERGGWDEGRTERREGVRGRNPGAPGRRCGHRQCNGRGHRSRGSTATGMHSIGGGAYCLRRHTCWLATTRPGCSPTSSAVSATGNTPAKTGSPHYDANRRHFQQQSPCDRRRCQRSRSLGVCYRTSDISAIDQGFNPRATARHPGAPIPGTRSDLPLSASKIVHYCVANKPRAVPVTPTFALINATLPYTAKLANLGVQDALRSDPGGCVTTAV